MEISVLVYNVLITTHFHYKIYAAVIYIIVKFIVKNVVAINVQ